MLYLLILHRLDEEVEHKMRKSNSNYKKSVLKLNVTLYPSGNVISNNSQHENACNDANRRMLNVSYVQLLLQYMLEDNIMSIILSQQKPVTPCTLPI
jgi:hypothetical protein